MSSCERYQQLLSMMIDGELSASQKTDLIDHIQSCEACSRLYADFHRCSDALAELCEPPATLSAGVMAALCSQGSEATPSAKAPKRRLGWFRPLALAACAALIIFAAGKSRLIEDWRMKGPELNAGTSPSSLPTVQNTAPVDSGQAESEISPDVPPPTDTVPDVSEIPAGDAEPQDDEPVEHNEVQPSLYAGQAIELLDVTQISVLSGNLADEMREPVVTFTDEASLRFIMELLAFDEPADGIEVTGDPIFMLDVTSEEGGQYSVRLWIIEGRLYCISDLTNTLYVAAGDASDLFDFIASA